MADLCPQLTRQGVCRGGSKQAEGGSWIDRYFTRDTVRTTLPKWESETPPVDVERAETDSISITVQYGCSREFPRQFSIP